MNDLRQPDQRRATFLALTAILVLAAFLRVWGCLGQGLPHSYYPDETSNVARVLAFGAEKTLDPNGWFNKPALGYYVILVEYGAYYGVGRLCGWWSNPREFGISYFENQEPFLLIGRLSTALFGVLTVLFAYRVGRRFGDETTGLISGLVLAVTLGHVASSQQVKMDIPAAFWNTWCLVAVFSIMARGRWRDYLTAGLLAGLGAATKYYSLAMVLPIGFAHLIRAPEARERSPRVWLSCRPVAAGAAVFAGFFVGSPYNTLDGWWQGRFWANIEWIFERIGVPIGEFQGSGARGASLVSEEHTLWDSFLEMMGNFCSSDGVGPLIAALAAAGCVVCLVKRERVHVLLLLTTITIPSLIALANRQFPLPRHLCVVYPLAAVLAAIGVREVCGLLRGRVQRFALGVATVALLAPVSGLPVGAVVEENRDRYQEDPRNLVLAWLAENVPPGAAVINDHARLPLVENEARCAWARKRLDQMVASAETAIKRAEFEPDQARRKKIIAYSTQRLARLRTRIVEWEFRSAAYAQYSGRKYDVLTIHHPWMTAKLEARPTAVLQYNQLWPRSPWAGQLNPLISAIAARGEKVSARAVARDFEEWLRSAYLNKAVIAVRRKAKLKQETFETLDDLERKVTKWLVERWDEMGGAWPHRAPSLVELWRRDTPLSRPWLVVDEANGQATRAISFFVSAKESYANYTDPRRPWKRKNFPDFADLYDDLERNYDCWEFNSDDPDESRLIRVWDLRVRRPGAGTVRVLWR